MVLVLCALVAVPALPQERVTYFHNDALGSPVAATDEDGDLLWTESYLPYGERVERTVSTDEHSAFYTGKPHDDGTGLTYLGARDYDPVLGRFMGMDPVGFEEANVQSFNKYAYASNNPYRFFDPDGRRVVDFSGDPRIAAALQSTKDNPVTQAIYAKADGHEQFIGIFNRRHAPEAIVEAFTGRVPTALTHPLHREDSFNGVGSGSIIFIDPTDKFSVPVAGFFQQDTPIELVIAHELFHAFENADGINTGRDKTNSLYGIRFSEYRARRFENRLRKEWNAREEDRSKRLRLRTGERFPRRVIPAADPPE